MPKEDELHSTTEQDSGGKGARIDEVDVPQDPSANSLTNYWTRPRVQVQVGYGHSTTERESVYHWPSVLDVEKMSLCHG